MKKMVFILKIGFSITLIFFVVKKVNLQVILTSVAKIDWRLFAIAVIIGWCSLVFQTSKWTILLAQAKPTHLFIATLKSFFCGMTLGLLSPGRAGEFGRGFFIPQVNGWLVLELTFVDKLSSIMAIGFMAIIAFWLQSYKLIACLTAILTVMLFLICLEWGKFRILGKILLGWITRNQQADVHPEIFIPRMTGLWANSLAILMYLAINAEFYVLLNSFETVPLKVVLAVLPLIMLINLVPITIGGLGIREGAAMLLMEKFGVTQAAAVNAAFLLFFLNVFVPAFIGALWLMVGHLKESGHP